MPKSSTLAQTSPTIAGHVARYMRDYYIYFVLVLVVALLSVANLDKFGLFERGNFLYERNIINILRISAPLLTLAGAFTLLMVSGYIDLSVGSAMSLSAVVYAMLAINGVPFLPAFATTLAVGAGLGLINGFLVVRLKITPVIATLITLSLYKGVALLLVQVGVSAI
jgi:ribose/xylose/arabinose/galactoside ABC-type transport system permease subunit